MTIAPYLSVDVHVAHVCSQSFHMLHHLQRVRRLLDADSAKTFVHAFVMLHLDYCNTLLGGSQNYMTDRLQWILNAAVQLILGTVRPGSINYHLCCTMICTGSTFQSIRLQTERHCALLLAGESSEVPSQLLYTSVGSCRPSNTTLSQLTTLYCAALPAEQIWALGLFRRRSYFGELLPGSSP